MLREMIEREGLSISGNSFRLDLQSNTGCALGQNGTIWHWTAGEPENFETIKLPVALDDVIELRCSGDYVSVHSLGKMPGSQGTRPLHVSVYFRGELSRTTRLPDDIFLPDHVVLSTANVWHVSASDRSITTSLLDDPTDLQRRRLDLQGPAQVVGAFGFRGNLIVVAATDDQISLHQISPLSAELINHKRLTTSAHDLGASITPSGDVVLFTSSKVLQHWKVRP